MRLCEYAKAARSTAIYPAEDWFVYPALGVGGEVGELCGKLDMGDLDGARKEIGDVLWYVANTAIDAGLEFGNILSYADTFIDIQNIPGMSITPLGMASLGGVVCELAKKFIRDDSKKMTDERREKVMVALGQILLGLASICSGLRQFTLDECANENIAKLRSRMERGKLQGSGDHR